MFVVYELFRVSRVSVGVSLGPVNRAGIWNNALRCRVMLLLVVQEVTSINCLSPDAHLASGKVLVKETSFTNTFDPAGQNQHRTSLHT